VRLLFEDNGLGIGVEMQPRIFVMFQRSSKDFEGRGIGLALVKKVTERMAGRIGV
jgi:signal transduction histidine kinase